MRSTTFEAFLAGIISPEYVGLETRGPPAHHLRLTHDGTPLEVSREGFAWFVGR